MINLKEKFFKLNLTPNINEETYLDGGGGILLFDKPSEYYQEKNRFVKNSCGEKNLQQVNLRTGKLSVHQFIYGVQGNRLPFNLTMTYNPTFAEQTEIFNDGATTSTHGKLIGKGWKLNYQQYVRNQFGKYYYYDENFEEHVFEQSTNDTSVYFDKSGQTGLTLRELTDGIEITDGKNTTLQFNTRGELVKIIEQKGSVANELTITYDSLNRVSCITDGMSRTFNFTYDDQECVILKQGEIELVKIINSTQLDHLLFLHRPIDNHYENITYSYARPANGSKYLLSGINDSKECALELANLLKGINCYVNLIPYNETSHIEYKKSSQEQILKLHLKIN